MGGNATSKIFTQSAKTDKNKHYENADAEEITMSSHFSYQKTTRKHFKANSNI